MQSAGQCILLHCVLEMTSHMGAGDAVTFASPFQMNQDAKGHLQSALQVSVHLLTFLLFFETSYLSLVIGL